MLNFWGKIIKLFKQKCCQESSVNILINHCSLFIRIHVGVRLKNRKHKVSNKCSPQDNRVSFKITSDQTPVKSVIQLSPMQNKEMKGQVAASLYLLL